MQQKIVLWFMALAVALGSMADLAVRTASAVTAPLVISAVQITGGEGKTAEDFIELYNPNPFPVDLNGYRIVKRSATGVTDSSIKSFSTETLVPAYSFYLWANSGFSSIAIIPDTTTSATLANDNGVGLRFGSLDTGELVDSVSWGSAANGFSNSGLANPAAGESIKRMDLFESLGYEIGLSNPRNSTIQALPDAVPADVNNSTCSAVPTSLSVSANQTAAVNLTFTNTGNTVWQSDSYLVRQLSPGGTTDLALGASNINPLSDLNLALQITAPATAGEYSYQWQMAVNGSLFGNACLFGLTVTATEPVPNPEPSLTTVRITEFLVNPSGDDGGQEIVELYNYGSQSVNIKDWVLDDISTWPVSTNAFMLPEQTLTSKQYVAITIPTGKFGLNNTGGDVLTLFNPSGAVISSVTYSSTAPEGKTYSLVDGQWYWIVPSLGVANPALPVEDPDDPPVDDPPPPEPDLEPAPIGLIISELYPAPRPSDAEFVELYNGTNTAVNLKTLKLAIGNRVASLPDLLLPSGAYYAVRGAELKLPLADSGKTIQLLTTDGLVVQEVSYPKGKKGQSYAWFEDSFMWTLSITPNLANQFLAEAIETKQITKEQSTSSGKVKSTSSPPSIQKNIAPANSLTQKKDLIPTTETTSTQTKKFNPINALAIALASLGAGVFAVYKFGLGGL